MPAKIKTNLPRLLRRLRYYFAIAMFLSFISVVLQGRLINDKLELFGQPFQEIAGSELGINLFRMKNDEAFRFIKAEFEFPVRSAALQSVELLRDALDIPVSKHTKTNSSPSGVYYSTAPQAIEFFFPKKDGSFLSVHFGEDYIVRIRNVSSGMKTDIATLNITGGSYSVSHENDALIISHDGQTFLRIDEDLPVRLKCFFRVGSRSVFYRSLIPFSLAFKMSKEWDQGRLIDIRLSKMLVVLSVILASLAVFSFCYFVPSLLVCLILPKRAATVACVLLYFMIPLLPIVLSFPSLLRYWNNDFLDWKNLTARIQSASADSLGDGKDALNESDGFGILLIGGSEAFGVPYGIKESISGCLADIASEKRERFRILNASKPAWRVADYVPLIEGMADYYKPDAVLVFSVFNNFLFDLNRMEDSGPLIRWSFHFAGLDMISTRWLFDDSRSEKIIADYNALHERLQARRIPLIVIDDPVDPRFEQEKYTRLRDDLHRFLKQKNVDVIPLFDAFSGDDSEFLYYDTCHLTTKGYRRAAEITWDFLQARRMLNSPPDPAKE